MSGITAIVRALVAAGATPEMILAAVEAAESQADDALTRRRKADAERQQRRRASKACHVTSRDVTVTPRDVTDAPLDGPLSPCTPFPPYNPPYPSPDTAREREAAAGNAGAAGQGAAGQPELPAVPKFQTDHEFPGFWHRYPNKTKQEAARHAWHTARQTATVSEIMGGLERYIGYLHGPDPPHPRNPDTWLNDKGWTDELMERTNARQPQTSRNTGIDPTKLRGAAAWEFAGRFTAGAASGIDPAPSGHVGNFGGPVASPCIDITPDQV